MSSIDSLRGGVKMQNINEKLEKRNEANVRQKIHVKRRCKNKNKARSARKRNEATLDKVKHVNRK
jgi:hypothetical protein